MILVEVSSFRELGEEVELFPHEATQGLRSSLKEAIQFC